MNWKAIITTLGVAAGTGVVTSVPAVIMQSLSTSGKVDPQLVGWVALAGALTGVSTYLAKSPLQPEPPKPQEPPKS